MTPPLPTNWLASVGPYEHICLTSLHACTNITIHSNVIFIHQGKSLRIISIVVVVVVVVAGGSGGGSSISYVLSLSLTSLSYIFPKLSHLGWSPTWLHNSTVILKHSKHLILLILCTSIFLIQYISKYYNFTILYIP